MTIGILQPGYLPWLGFFEQAYKSDLFVIYDDVQYDKHSWRNRNRIKTAQGEQWLTVPVLTRGKSKPLVKDVSVDNSGPWSIKHLKAIRQNYGKTLFYDSIFPICEDILGRRWKYLIDVDMAFIYAILDFLGIENKTVFSSTLGIKGERNGRLIDICRHFQADTFYEGAAGQDYIQADAFRDAGIELSYQNYQHPRYRQQYGDFISHLSVIDLLFNHGKESLDVLLGNKVL